MTSLILGTAQFGSGYGITNGARRITDAVVGEVLTHAASSGITMLDTSSQYDDSEERLGALRSIHPPSEIVTKFVLPEPGQTVDRASLFTQSMQRLRVSHLYGLLFHRMSDLADERAQDALAILRDARRGGTIRKIGVSAYGIDDLRLVRSHFPDLDVIQIPGSVADRRLIDSSELADLRSTGVEVHVRSAFLQGMLLADPAALTPQFDELKPALREFRALADRQHTTPMELALRFLRHHESVDRVLVGVTRVAELEGVVNAWASGNSTPVDLPFSVPDRILDPRLWSR